MKYGVPSLNPEDPRFDQLQYWRGPVWLIINWMISNGLRHYGYVNFHYTSAIFLKSSYQSCKKFYHIHKPSIPTCTYDSISYYSACLGRRPQSQALCFCRYEELAERIKQDSFELTNKAGLREYFDPLTGDGCGGRQFSWTAAMCLAWLDRPAAIGIGHKLSGPQKQLE